MVRAYRSTLHQLCDAGPRKKGNWDKVLTYVHQNSSSSDGGGGVSVPSASLVAEALSREGPRDDETPLRVCALRAPSRVIAALIRVAPEATRVADAEGRLPLHLACRRPTGGARDGSRATPGADAEAVLRVLVEIHPGALVRRDARGRTPLHALLAFHAHSRARSTVELLSRALPAEAFSDARSAEDDAARGTHDSLAVELTDDGESAEVTAKSHFAFSLSMKDAVPVPTPDGEALPFNAAIIPDDDGRLPLHIAAEEGAARETLKALVRAYPDGVAKGDRDGRTPLHLYLDVGFPYEVASEDTPPPPPRSTNVVATLLTDEVARVADDDGRLPLHAACRSLALSLLLKPSLAENTDDAIALSISAGLGARGGGDKEGSVKIRAVRMLVDAHRDAVLAGDHEGRTPLHVFLGTPFEHNKKAYELYRSQFRDPESTYATNAAAAMAKHFTPDLARLLRPFNPPEEIVRMLVSTPSRAYSSSIKKRRRRRTRRRNHHRRSPPQSRDADMFVPEVSSSDDSDDSLYSEDEPSPRSGQQPAPESEHPPATEKEEEDDEETACHLEDHQGRLPLHHAAASACSPEILSSLISRHPSALITTDDCHGRAPLHVALGHPATSNLMDVERLAALLDGVLGDGVLDGRCVVRVHDLSNSYPLHLAAAHGCPRDVMEVLWRACPEACRQTNEDGDLPVHLLLDDAYFSALRRAAAVRGRASPAEALAVDARAADNPFQLRSSVATVVTPSIAAAVAQERDDRRRTTSMLTRPLSDTPSLWSVPGGRRDVAPLHVAAAHDALSVAELTEVLAHDPVAARRETSGGSDLYVPSDLHQALRTLADELDGDERVWEDKRALLFAHCPDRLPYRRDQALIDRLVSVVRAEAARLLQTEQPTTTTTVDDRSLAFAVEKKLSEVARRTWIFFVTFRNSNDDADHYAAQVEAVVDGLDHAAVEALVAVEPEGDGPRDEDQNTTKTPSALLERAHPDCAAKLNSCFYFCGRYELPLRQPSMFSHRRRSVVLRADEHTFRNDHGRFRTIVRKVCLKFLRSEREFRKEIHNRADLGDDDDRVLPVLKAYDALNPVDDDDRRYARDVRDDRFRLFERTGTEADADLLSLADFPFALATSAGDRDLRDVLDREGSDKDGARRAALDAATALRAAHANNVVHGDVDPANLVRLPDRRWALTDLGASRKTPVFGEDVNGEKAGALGAFRAGTLPPEMFARLDPAEARLHKDYWDGTNDDDAAAVAPRFGPNGEVFCVKAYRPSSSGDKHAPDPDAPPLPYDLVPASEAHDVWAFGLMLYSLCADGRTLFPIDPRSGDLTEVGSYHELVHWTKTSAEDRVCEFVDDPLAQDLLMRLLVPEEDREEMASVVDHPYFRRHRATVDEDTQRLLVEREIVAKRVAETRSRRFKTAEDRETLRARTTEVFCVSLRTQTKILNSPTELCRRIYGATRTTPDIPLCFVVLPYRLVPNKVGKLTPSTKRDVELAERVGKQFLNLSKASAFVLEVDKILKDNSGSWELWADECRTDSSRVAHEIVRLMGCSDDFMDLASALTSLGVLNTDQFLTDPLSVAKKLVQESAKAVLKTFDDADKAFLYLVDEYDCVPVLDADDDTYPYAMGSSEKSSVSQTVRSLLPFTQMGILCANGAQGSVAGLVKLIFEGAYPHIPGSWTAASKGLDHKLDRERMSAEVELLKEAVEGFESFELSRKRRAHRSNVRDADLLAVETLFDGFDLKRAYSGMKRVVHGRAALWTTRDTVDSIVKESDPSYVMSEYENILKLQKDVEEKEIMIKALQTALRERPF